MIDMIVIIMQSMIHDPRAMTTRVVQGCLQFGAERYELEAWELEVGSRKLDLDARRTWELKPRSQELGGHMCTGQDADVMASTYVAVSSLFNYTEWGP